VNSKPIDVAVARSYSRWTELVEIKGTAPISKNQWNNGLLYAL
jgi:hypothetical protein